MKKHDNRLEDMRFQVKRKYILKSQVKSRFEAKDKVERRFCFR